MTSGWRSVREAFSVVRWFWPFACISLYAPLCVVPGERIPSWWPPLGVAATAAKSKRLAPDRGGGYGPPCDVCHIGTQVSKYLRHAPEQHEQHNEIVYFRFHIVTISVFVCGVGILHGSSSHT